MTVKTTISLTDEHAERIHEAVESGNFSSTSEVVRAALRDWLARQEIRRLWQEGIESGLADPNLTAADIKAKARARRTKR